MLASWILAMLASTPCAEAAAELQVRAAGPVVVLVDGRPTTVMSNLKMRAADLDPGLHEIRVATLFGRVLFEGDVELPDGRITHAEWANRELRIVGSTPLAGEREGIDDDPAVDPASDPIASIASDATEDAAAAVADPAPTPGEPAEAVAADDVPLAIPVVDREEVEDEAPGALVAIERPAAPRQVSVELREGMALDVRYGDAVVRLVVEEGALVLDDGEGFRLELK